VEGEKKFTSDTAAELSTSNPTKTRNTSQTHIQYKNTYNPSLTFHKETKLA